MRNTLIMGVLFIGIVTLVSGNTYADFHPGDYVARSDEKALDLSKPENLKRLMGTWEGHWKNMYTGRYGQVLQKYSVDAKDDEKPLVIQTKRRPAGLLGGPDRWGSSRGKIEAGKVELVGLRGNTTLTLYERTDGTLILRGFTEGFGENSSTQMHSEQRKLQEGQVSKYFPPDKKGAGSEAAEAQ